uniref:Uncharacterized protein n=1 Tax=Tetranychus urticae TaxID=32264 RepID=T1L6I1_TETUR
MLFTIAIVLGGIAIGNVVATQRNALIELVVILSVSLLCNGFLFALLGRYTAELFSVSYG